MTADERLVRAALARDRLRVEVLEAARATTRNAGRLDQALEVDGIARALLASPGYLERIALAQRLADLSKPN